MTPFRFASEKQNKFFLDEINKSRGQYISILIRTTFHGKPNEKKVAKRRARNKLARKQRRINRLRGA